MLPTNNTDMKRENDSEKNAGIISWCSVSRSDSTSWHRVQKSKTKFTLLITPKWCIIHTLTDL